VKFLLKRFEDQIQVKENALAQAESEWQEKENHWKLQQVESEKTWKQKDLSWKKKRRGFEIKN